MCRPLSKPGSRSQHNEMSVNRVSDNDSHAKGYKHGTTIGEI